ncbi:MAG: AraC family transcriptional regulator [Lachnospiraceae bacterium]|nr:AraC family transcriptional regulator [Lachnospiraceae bacterium]
MISVTGISYEFFNPGGVEIYREQGTGDFLFLHIRTGMEAVLDPAEGYVTVPPDAFLLFNRGDPQIYRKTDGHFINDWIHFTVDPYDDFFEKLGIPFLTPMLLPRSSVISDLIRDLYREYYTRESGENGLDEMAATMFRHLGTLYQDSLCGKRSGKYLAALTEIRREILDFTWQPASVTEIAKKLNLSVSYLQHLYKDTFGTTVSEDLIDGRIRHAAGLLRETDKSISEISSLCGYENLEHFSRQFKSRKGCSPQKYRQITPVPTAAGK